MSDNKVSSEVAPGLVIEAPHWFDEPDFLAHLATREDNIATGYQGGPCTEFADVFVLVDGWLNGEGSDSTMPHWDDVMLEVKKHFRPFRNINSPYILVQIKSA